MFIRFLFWSFEIKSISKIAPPFRSYFLSLIQNLSAINLDSAIFVGPSLLSKTKHIRISSSSDIRTSAAIIDKREEFVGTAHGKFSL